MKISKGKSIVHNELVAKYLDTLIKFMFVYV